MEAGHSLKIYGRRSGLSIRLDLLRSRAFWSCPSLPNVSPETGIRDKAVPYKVLMKIRVGIDPKQKWKACVGCNGFLYRVGQYLWETRLWSSGC
ncbi:hypothetical protein BDZ89DRAFT_604837 [Hymenopellis radicata]|nr:hypothetical protein BDZ89DRAFT_604837 [Hymenopellis radicata]